jgi:hypothetical protein
MIPLDKLNKNQVERDSSNRLILENYQEGQKPYNRMQLMEYASPNFQTENDLIRYWVRLIRSGKE